MINLLLVHVSGTDRTKHIFFVNLAQHERHKHITPRLCFSNSPHARFIFVWIWHNGRCTHENLLYFFFGNTMLSTLRPIAIVPIEPKNFHIKSVCFCVYICNVIIFNGIMGGRTRSIINHQPNPRKAQSLIRLDMRRNARWLLRPTWLSQSCMRQQMYIFE